MPSTDRSYVDLEIRVFRSDERVRGYPVEITLGGERELARGVLAASVLPWVPSADLTADGQQLFDTLFSDKELHGAWTEARGNASRRRVRLRIDPLAPELHALPWELLQDGADLLSAQADTPFSRYLPIALPWGGPVQERPIRVLVVLSDPRDIEAQYGLPRADVAKERENLEAVFSTVNQDDLQVHYLDAPVTLEKLEDALYDGDYHILHYLGHGAFLPKRRQAVLYLQDADGCTRPVRDDALVSMLARRSIRPRLIFLAACESAARSNAGAFVGLAPKLVSVGVPTVVAMQDLVSVESARTFSATFYRQLLKHGQVDQAANEARSTLLTAGRPDAAVPVLFMRLKSGRLWGGEADARGTISGEGDKGRFWTRLVRKIRQGQCIPIIGPRVHGRWLPTSPELARQLADTYEYPLANRDDLAQVAQYLAITEGLDTPRDEILYTLAETLSDRLPEELRPGSQPETLSELVRAVGWENLAADDPNEVHQILASLDLPLYLTTNFDSFMVEALSARGKDPVRELLPWRRGVDVDWPPSRFAMDDEYEPTPQAPLVYHLFGNDTLLPSLVLTEDDYLDYLVRIEAERQIPSPVRERLSNSVLLFVGYSLYDWEFRVLMHGLVANLRRRNFNHVAVQLQIEGAEGQKTDQVHEFLQQHFKTTYGSSVFWGSCAQFVAELREKWETGGR